MEDKETGLGGQVEKEKQRRKVERQLEGRKSQHKRKQEENAAGEPEIKKRKSAGGLGGASCPQGGDIPHDPWKGGTQGGGGGLDTFPPVPPSTGLGESPQNSEEKIEAEQRKIEEKETEIERELRRTEKE